MTLTPERAKAQLRDAIDAFNRGDLTAYHAFYAPDAIIHGLPRPFPATVGGHREYLIGMRAGLPDMTVVMHQVIAEDHLVAARLTYRGTHLGELSGVHPSGRGISWEAMTFRRMDDSGLVVERWIIGDTLAFLRQLGLTTTPLVARDERVG